MYESMYLLGGIAGMFGGLIPPLLIGGIVWLVIYLINKNKNKKMQQNQNLDQLEQVTQSQGMTPPPTKKKEEKYSKLSVIMAVVLFIVLVLFFERTIFDLNRFLNPVVDKEYQPVQSQTYSNYPRRDYDYDAPKTPMQAPQMAFESSNVGGGARVYYKRVDMGRYTMYKLIIHAAVIIPIFIFSFVLFYLKKKERQWRPLLISFMAVAFWLMAHLLFEVIAFVMMAYRNIAVYVILIILALVFGILAFFAQKKFSKEKEGKTQSG